MQRTDIDVSPTSKLLAICGAFLCIAALSVTGTQQGLMAFIGGVGALFFGLVTYLLAPALFRSGPALVIDDEGVTDRTPLLGVGLIPWEEIEEVAVGQSSGRTYLFLTVPDVEQYLAQIGAIRRFVAKLHPVPSSLPIDLASLNADGAAVGETIGRELALRSGGYNEQAGASGSGGETEEEPARPAEPASPVTGEDSSLTATVHSPGTGAATVSDQNLTGPSSDSEKAPASPSQVERMQQASDDLEALEKLADLRDKGILTEEEFTRKKKQILGS